MYSPQPPSLFPAALRECLPSLPSSSFEEGSSPKQGETGRGRRVDDDPASTLSGTISKAAHFEEDIRGRCVVNFNEDASTVSTR
ncbi:hypothetical protein BLNAU_16192 [Blattamonas nauphoetae]|uniref:Uncharacterized protein n=1 Tax=Blattamonas nauphoetae TaxID=2049346 RepID=A0ABQ9XDB1_9EUKA|nr:hypothetical protein BLNAU_16192 [Blattamonas nauphoetae]